ncbi:MAG: dTMP kinase [Candidatus Altiarchaeota archaeon]
MAFIVLEGIDGCGKSTHARLLAEWLVKEGRDVVLTAEPTDGKIGVFIREVLSGRETVDPKTLSMLFTADRYEHLLNRIEPALAEGKIVVSERYYYSTIAYQSAQGVDWNWLFEINKFARKPDLTILLDVKPDEGASRTDTNEIFEKSEFLAEVRDNYLKFQDVSMVETRRPTGEVQDRIRSIVSDMM